MLFEQIINGLTIGSIYALVAIGYTMVFGVLELVNFANGSVYMLGGYIALMAYMALGQHFLVCFLLAIAGAVCILTYAGMQKAKYNKEANPSPERRRRGALVGKLCGCIMLAATIVYMILGFVYNLWERAWIVYAVGGILCGIVAIALSRDREE